MKLVAELPKEVYKWIRLRDFSDFVAKAVSELGVEGVAPGLLGSGAYSSAWDIGDDKVLKIGLKENLPLYMDKIYGQLDPLKYVAEPVIDYRRKSPKLLEAGIYPRARTIDQQSLDLYDDQDKRLGSINWGDLPISEEDLKMLKVFAATVADRKGRPGSLLAKSYASQDLHPYNLGILPNKSVVSIDSGAGLVEVPSPETLRKGYPRRAYYVGPDILERWAEGYLQPPGSATELLTPDSNLGAVLRRLSGWRAQNELQ